jgi:hypothetical protein
MHAFTLQDWTTIRGASNVTVIQGESGWLDLTPYQDAYFWLDVREVSGGTVTVTFQTAPTKDESLFMPLQLGTAYAAASGSATPTVVLARMSSGTASNPPIARFVRWQLSPPGATWDITFRVLVAANTLGQT